MNNQDYHSEAKDVIDTICDKIIQHYEFKIDPKYYFPSTHRKVIYKNTLEINFFWDFKDAQIFWSFKKRNEHRGLSFELVNPKSPRLESIKIFGKFHGQFEASQNDERFYPQVLKLGFLRYLELWYETYPKLFEQGNYEIIEHLERERDKSESVNKRNEEERLIKEYIESKASNKRSK